eukprot:gb/GECH01007193.1/.p1 GENE.gb/GECH01007193.1/~~gb/GECH01007193.1/.p1  ORF type:complete len:127 (+),score=15.68 gb/GECH01007193.1/:1-381(+)
MRGDLTLSSITWPYYLVAAIVLASKMYEDRYLRNSQWSEAIIFNTPNTMLGESSYSSPVLHQHPSGYSHDIHRSNSPFPPQIQFRMRMMLLNKLEVALLHALDYRLVVSPNMYNNFVRNNLSLVRN